MAVALARSVLAARQLARAVLALVERVPVCAICAAPATCWGSYEDGPLSTFPALLAEIEEARVDP